METYTQLKHEAILKKWKQQALSRNEDPIDTSVECVLSFLLGMYTKGCLYSGLCGVRTALSSFVCVKGFSKLSDHPMISRYLKGFLIGILLYLSMHKYGT